MLTRDPVRAYVGVGANLGDAAATVRAAIDAMAAWPEVAACAASGLYRSAPFEADGPAFINAVVCLHTTQTAPALLRALQGLENAAGRQRPYRNAPRTLDLDVLLYGQAQVRSPDLTVPHPRWLQRAFVLLPLAELAPERVPTEALAAVADQDITRLS